MCLFVIRNWTHLCFCQEWRTGLGSHCGLIWLHKPLSVFKMIKFDVWNTSRSNRPLCTLSVYHISTLFILLFINFTVYHCTFFHQCCMVSSLRLMLCSFMFPVPCSPMFLALLFPVSVCLWILIIRHVTIHSIYGLVWIMNLDSQFDFPGYSLNKERKEQKPNKQINMLRIIS